MFAEAISKVSQFTRPIHSILRVAGSKEVTPGSATLFFVNDDGVAITCKHVAKLLTDAEHINLSHRRNREAGIAEPSGTLIQMRNTFVDCFDKLDSFTVITHPTADLALIRFHGYKKLMISSFPKFKSNAESIKQGKFLCRIGYPFPEFTNYRLNSQTNDIEWTESGNKKSPVFPIEGMVTRFLGNSTDGVFGIEMSTPGLRGQSGGPLFDEKGVIYGIQSRTKHLHLGFDLEDHEVEVKGLRKKINDYSFIHLGECVHIEVIKKFLGQHQVKFTEE